MTDAKSDPAGGAVPKGREDTRLSLSRLFNWGVVGLFLLQLSVGLFVISQFVGDRMVQSQIEHGRSELECHVMALESYLDSRLALLKEFSRLPALSSANNQALSATGQVKSFVDSLFILEEGAAFTLQNAQGSLVHASRQWASLLAPSGYEFETMLADGKLGAVSFVNLGVDEPIWRLSCPVVFQSRIIGVLCSYFPVRPEGLALDDGMDRSRIVVLHGDTPVLAVGVAEAPAMSLRRETRFPGVAVELNASQKDVSDQVFALTVGMVLTLAAGTLLLMAAIHWIGRALYIVPNARLQAMREELEKEVEKRTADLKMRTVQLSIEIRERRESEIEARESGQLVSALLEGIGAAFFILDPRTGHVVRSNSVVHKMFGLAPWQLSDRPCSEAFAKSAGVIEDLLCPRAIKANTYTEGIARHVDGQSFPVARYLVPMELKGEDHIGVIVLDITERRNLERRLNIAQKLESVGELASGIAHEINTPIQYVGDSIRFVKEAFSEIAAIVTAQTELEDRCREASFELELVERVDDLKEEADLDFVLEEVPKACARALEGSERVAVIVRAMKNFAHPGDGEKKAVDINAALENTITVAKNEWKYVAEVVRDFDSLPMVQCLAGDINQVFLNILVNAAHAIGEVVGNSGEKGTITIATRRGEHEIQIHISDTGIGIPPEIRNKIFDPFFTTKEVGKGTGQGLAIVHDIIVERHGGVIDVESEVGKGSTFIIRLPFEE
jgi:PAS domain S-box-containing protein